MSLPIDTEKEERKRMKTTLCVRSLMVFVVLLVICSGVSVAQVPRTITYQGSVNQAVSGTPVDGNVSMTFRLYDALTGGIELWNETHSTVTVDEGIYSVNLGTVMPLDTLAFDKPYYLELSIGGELLTPRQPLTSVPYAQRAVRVDDFVVSETAGIKSIRVPLPSNGLFRVGDVWTGDKTFVEFRGSTLGLCGGPTDGYPIFSIGDMQGRAMYLGNGSKTAKKLSLVLDNGHVLNIIGSGFPLTIDTTGSRFEIGTEGTETHLKLTHGTGLAIKRYNGDVGLLVRSSNGYIGIGSAQYPQYQLDVAGTIRGENVSPSDLRWKEAIAPVDDALDRVMQLRGVTFRWTDPSRGTGPQIGVIAQEVEQVFPELVSADSAGYKSVAYDRLAAPLIEAVKALKAENDALKAENSRMKEDFERRLTALEAVMNSQ